MYKNKQRIALVLSVLIASSVLISCSGTPDETEPVISTEPASETVPESKDYLETLPIADYGGQSVRFIARHDSGSRINFPEETTTGETINDALFTRNQRLEELLDIRIENNAVAEVTDLMSMTSTAVLATDDAYDVILADMADTARTLMLQEALFSYDEIPHVDLTQKWWSPYNADLAIGGKHFFPTGPISPMFFNATYLMLFNQTLAENFQLEDLYDTALSGGWTLDKLDTIITETSQDLNGDGKMDLEDQWSLVYDEVAGFAFYFGAGGKMTEFDAEKMPYLNIGSEQTVSLIEKLRSIVGNKDYCLRGENYEKNAEQSVFLEGRSLFAGQTINHVRTIYREMENDFGILPMPKLDENQQEYYSYSQPWSGTGAAVPITNSKLDMTGLVLEAMAYLSDTYVREAVYETTYKGKVARDARTAEVLDIITQGARFDLNVFFNWGGSANKLRDAVMGDNENYVSSYESVKTAAATAIEELCTQIREIQ